MNRRSRRAPSGASMGGNGVATRPPGRTSGVGSIFTEIGNLLGTLFSPIHTVFQYVFFLPVFNILMLIYQGVHSFGLSIILLTLLIRGSLYPLTRKQLA